MDDFLYGLGQGMQGFWNAYQGAKTSAEDRAFKQKQLELQEAAKKAEMDKALRDQAKEQEKQKFEQEKFSYQKQKDLAEQSLKERELAQKLAEKKSSMDMGKIIPAAEVSKSSDADVALQQLANVEKITSEHGDLFGTGAGLISQARSALNMGDNPRKVDASLRLAAQNVGKYMEGGVLRKEDEEKYYRMMPNFGDSAEVRAFKINQVREMLESKKQGDLEKLGKAGYNVANLYQAPGQIQTKQAAPIDQMDQAALIWAKQNPKDPRALSILNKFGVK